MAQPLLPARETWEAGAVGASVTQQKALRAHLCADPAEVLRTKGQKNRCSPVLLQRAVGPDIHENRARLSPAWRQGRPSTEG